MTKEKDEYYERYGWRTSEDNLKTLPASAPQAAKDLAQWLTLEGRRSSLAEWIAQADKGRIHGKCWHIGAWTHRCSHSSPNLANIPAILGRDPETPVEEIKARYDHKLRELFEADPHAWLVGCDADGIQLRILAHLMKSEDYRDAILAGDKSKGTDIHSLNRNALGTVCKDRDDAKTFIYAWILGAGIPKIASILGCSVAQARHAVDSFLASLPELKRLKESEIPVMAARGGFTGLDGRWVECTSQHLMLAGLLQNSEAVIMKHANVLWQKELAFKGYNFKQVNFVHDEWQTVVFGTEEEAEAVGRIQARALETTGKNLKMFIPITGSYRCGRNWKETH